MLKCQKAKGSNQNVKCPENVGKGQKKGGGAVRASGFSVEILRKPVRFLQFLVEFIQKVVYISIFF